jgi:hypothetical protein
MTAAQQPSDPQDSVSREGGRVEVHSGDRRGGSIQVWCIWLSVNVVVAAYFVYGLFAPESAIKSIWLPGKTTHGHYQIELDCNACHRPSGDASAHSSDNVMQDACIRCHGDQLKTAKDTHPATKFNDPTNADRLSVLDAQNCLTCHREHVPDQTLAMGLTVPEDYCWHCHQEVADTRPSHQGMAFDSCATAGCHNYHDNRALYEKYLNDHFGEPDHLDPARVVSRNFAKQWTRGRERSPSEVRTLSAADADAPANLGTPAILHDWASTAHAAAGVNCSGCHQVSEREQATQAWSDAVALETCSRCHPRQADSFQTGKHGMRLAAGMSPMTPSQARLTMHSGAAHTELTCNACHPGHRFDSGFAATQACLRCHADSHSLAYADSPHASRWREERSGVAASGSGVSCATCHLPRLSDGDNVWVNHDQSSNLRPNETMAREVCGSCHGLEYSLSVLSDRNKIRSCFSEPPSTRTESVRMAHQWFEQQALKREQRKRRNPPGPTGSRPQ